MRPFLRGASSDFIAGPSSRCLPLATVAAASTAGKLRKSDAITRLPMAFKRYATHPLPTNGSAAVSKFKPRKTPWIHGNSRCLEPMNRNSGYAATFSGNGTLPNSSRLYTSFIGGLDGKTTAAGVGIIGTPGKSHYQPWVAVTQQAGFVSAAPCGNDHQLSPNPPPPDRFPATREPEVSLRLKLPHFHILLN